ncbi:MAG: hypothetical protein VW378_08005 [bacterium]
MKGLIADSSDAGGKYPSGLKHVGDTPLVGSADDAGGKYPSGLKHVGDTTLVGSAELSAMKALAVFSPSEAGRVSS